MKVASCQMDSAVGDWQANYQKISSFVQEASRADCQLVIFPELADYGFDLPTSIGAASAFKAAGSPYRDMSGLAQKHSVAIGIGLTEKTNGESVYNAYVVFGSDGKRLAKYRKTHLFSMKGVEEQKFICPGAGPVTFDLAGIKLGLAVCYDLRFPEMFRQYAVAGVEAVLLGSAFPFPRLEHWNTLVRARAIENQFYLVAANRIGVDGDLTFCGSSRIIDPFGVIMASASEIDETLITGDVSAEKVHQVRSEIPVLEDRRPELYSDGQ